MKLGRKALEAACRELAGMLEPRLKGMFGQRVGFALLVFDFGSKGNMAYLSNAERDGMISLVKEWLALLEGGLTTDPTGPRAEG